MGVHRPERLHAVVDVAEALGLGAADVRKLARSTLGSGLQFEQNIRRPRVLDFVRPAFVDQHLADLEPELWEVLARIEAREGLDHVLGEMTPICIAEADEARQRADAAVERDRFTESRPTVGGDGRVTWEPSAPEYGAPGLRVESTYAAHRREMQAKWGVRSSTNRWGAV